MFTFNVTPDAGESFTVTATTRDIVKWETAERGRSFANLTSDMKLSDLYAIAHVASVRAGQFTGTLNDFINSVDFDLANAGDEVNPTRPAR